MHYAAASGNSYEALQYFVHNVFQDNPALSNVSITKGMQLAAALGHQESLIILLSRLSHPNEHNDDGQTAMHLVIETKNCQGNEFVNSRANINFTSFHRPHKMGITKSFNCFWRKVLKLAIMI